MGMGMSWAMSCMYIPIVLILCIVQTLVWSIRMDTMGWIQRMDTWITRLLLSTNSTDLNQLICFFQDDKSYISSEWVSVQDGRIFCQFYREGTTSVKGTSFDLKSDTKYHVMLAMGKAGDGGETLGFDSWIQSANIRHFCILHKYVSLFSCFLQTPLLNMTLLDECLDQFCTMQPLILSMARPRTKNLEQDPILSQQKLAYLFWSLFCGLLLTFNFWIPWILEITWIDSNNNSNCSGPMTFSL